MSLCADCFRHGNHEGHALGNPAGLATKGNKVCCPDETAHDSVVVLLHILREVVRRLAPSHQPAAPVNCLTVVNIFLRVKQMIKESLQVLWSNCHLLLIPRYSSSSSST